MNINYELPELVNKSNVLDLFKAIQQHANKSSNKFSVDCAKVINVDSAGIALLLELSTSPKFINLVTLINLSSSIQELCQLYQINL